MNLLTDKDADVIKMLYCFVICSISVVLAVVFPGNVWVLTAIVAMLLIKDGMPNFVVGLTKITEKKK